VSQRFSDGGSTPPASTIPRGLFAINRSQITAILLCMFHILREVVAESARPAMLYSVGKDSSVMLRLAQKAFHPGRIPFPLLHIDTGFKFHEMIEFRERTCRELELQLLVHINEEAKREGANPLRLGTSRCCGLLKTKALLDALVAKGIDAPLAVHDGMRRNRGQRNEFFRYATR
jgi:sulfate adenylyltransferase subunit 2